jgi:hypothetical protein
MRCPGVSWTPRLLYLSEPSSPTHGIAVNRVDWVAQGERALCDEMRCLANKRDCPGSLAGRQSRVALVKSSVHVTHESPFAAATHRF